MSRTTRRTLGVAAAGACLLAAASAHDFWAQPAHFRVPVGMALPIALHVGHGDEIDPVPWNAARVERCFASDGKRTIEATGRDGEHPAASIVLDAPGTWVIGYRSRDSRSELEAAKFEAYLLEEGLERVRDERAKRGESAKAGRELYSRCAKAIVRAVGEADGAPSNSIAAAPVILDVGLGLPLELIAERDPSEPSGDGPLPFRLVLRGEPLEGALVEAIRLDPTHTTLAGRTDRDGRVSFALAPGAWRVAAVSMERVGEDEDVDAEWRSLWATLTFEIPPPAEDAKR